MYASISPAAVHTYVLSRDRSREVSNVMKPVSSVMAVVLAARLL